MTYQIMQCHKIVTDGVVTDTSWTQIGEDCDTPIEAIDQVLDHLDGMPAIGIYVLYEISEHMDTQVGFAEFCTDHNYDPDSHIAVHSPGFFDYRIEQIGAGASYGAAHLDETAMTRLVQQMENLQDLFAYQGFDEFTWEIVFRDLGVRWDGDCVRITDHERFPVYIDGSESFERVLSACRTVLYSAQGIR